MAISKRFFFLLILIVLFGCTQKLPDHESGFGMIGIPYHLINRTDFSFLNSYEWISSSDDRFSVKVEYGTYNKDVALSDLIPAGSYNVDSLVVRTGGDTQVETYRSKQIIEIEYPFTVDIVDGVIMLAPYVLEVEQYIESESIYLNPSIHEFDDEDEAFYAAQLRKREGFEQWKIEILGEGRDITEAEVIGDSRKVTEIFEANKLAAEGGDSFSQHKVGMMYYHGEGVSQTMIRL